MAHHLPKAFALALMLLVPTLAEASGINVQTIIPSTSNRFTLTEDALLSYDQCCGFFGGLNYAFLNDPLVVVNTSKNSQEQVLLDHVHTLDAYAGMLLRQNISVSLAAPFNLVRAPDGNERYGFGDVRANAKWRFTSTEAPVPLALMPELRFPTGNTGTFTSDNSWMFGFRLTAEKDLRVVVLAAHAGYWRFSSSTYGNLQMRNRFPLGIGAYFPFYPDKRDWAANFEFNTQPVLTSDSTLNPSQFYAGLRYESKSGPVIHAGASIGKLGGPTGSDYGIHAGFRWNIFSCPEAVAAEPKKEAPAPVPTPTPTPVVPRVRLTEKAIEISEEVKFKEGSDILTESGKSLLDEVGALIKHHQRGFKHIRIEGHTNRHGGKAFNLALSKRRAVAVKEYLMSRGVPGKLLTTEGFGFSRPKDVEGLSAKQHLEVDRRVEFKVEH